MNPFVLLALLAAGAFVVSSSSKKPASGGAGPGPLPVPPGTKTNPKGSPCPTGVADAGIEGLPFEQRTAVSAAILSATDPKKLYELADSLDDVCQTKAAAEVRTVAKAREGAAVPGAVPAVPGAPIGLAVPTMPKVGQSFLPVSEGSDIGLGALSTTVQAALARVPSMLSSVLGAGLPNYSLPSA